jgi:adenylate kinase family enzyme
MPLTCFCAGCVQESFPDARRLIEAGEMIPDTLVGDLLLEALLLDEPGLQDDLGFVVDGFPRTACQVSVKHTCMRYIVVTKRVVAGKRWLPAFCLSRGFVRNSCQADSGTQHQAFDLSYCWWVPSMEVFMATRLCGLLSALRCPVFWCAAACRSTS